jgi:hypothetical protein
VLHQSVRAKGNKWQIQFPRASDICSTISMLAVTPLSLQALEFERTRLISLYLSFAYSEMAEAIYFLDSGLKKRAS